MTTYGDVEVRLNGLSPDDFGDRAAAAAVGGWARERAIEEMSSRPGAGRGFAFTLSGHPRLPPALVFLAFKGPEVLHVPNVISTARERLDYNEYNAILEAFRDDVLRRVQPPGSIDVALTGTTIDLPGQLPPEVFNRLLTFNFAANKAVGVWHPYDRERWMDFLMAAVDAGADLAPRTLERWLVEEGHWTAEQASRLSQEYEFGRELLERRRRAS